MAAIIEFQKPLVGGANHAFSLLQNDAGEFTDIARGGPQSTIGGSNGLPSGGYNTGAGFGSIVANVEPYNLFSGTPAARDFFSQRKSVR